MAVNKDDLFKVGIITTAHGVHGEVKVFPTTDDVKRFKKAKELLLGTNLKLYEISDRIGYNDPKYFSRVFKEATGMLPADFRKSK